MIREEFKQWCHNKRLLHYESRKFGKAIQEFQEHAEILLRCDQVRVFLPNLRDKKHKSFLKRHDGYGTGIEMNPKLCMFILNTLKGKRPEIVNDKAIIADLNLKKLFEQRVTSILIVPFTSNNQPGSASVNSTAFAVKFGDDNFEPNDRELLHKLGNLYGGLREHQSNDPNELKLRRRKIFKWMSNQVNRRKRDKRQSVVALKSTFSGMRNTNNGKKSDSVNITGAKTSTIIPI